MTIKYLNFLSGLPRSGSTLVATLLNQHPQIYASPHSALLDGLCNLKETFIHSESVKFQLRTSAYQKTLWNLPQLFYNDIEKEVIFDKQFTWTTPDNYDLALKVSIYPRFVVCYRPILEVLASFVSKAADNPNFYLNKELDSINFYSKNYLTRNDAMAEFLMCGHDLIPKCLLGLAHAKKNEELGIFKFVAYDNLIQNPQKEILDIFEFLNLEPINVQTENIQEIFMYNDFFHIGAKGFHQVRSQIKKESIDPKDLFSEFILNKYNNALSPMGL
jgi:sulfotransferase